MWRSLAPGLLLAAMACGDNHPKSNDARPADSQPIDADLTPDAPSFPANAPPVGDCQSGWCWVDPLPQGYPINGIWGTSEQDVWAFASDTILHFDGTAWTVTPVPAECPVPVNWVASAWGSGPNDVWATGGCTIHWDGTTWKAYPRPTELPGTWTYDRAIGGLGPSDLWKAGSGRSWHWDGTTWTEVGIPYVEVLAIGGSGTTTLAVASDGRILKWSVGGWGFLDTTSHPARGAVVLDATHIVVAQEGGSISFWTADTWTTETAPVDVDWLRIAATSPSDVWVVGSDDTGAQVAYHWNGTSWSAAGATTDRSYPSALWHAPNGALWLGSEGSRISAWNGTTWTAKTTGDNRAVVTWGTDWDNVWTLGTYSQYKPIGSSQIPHYVGDIKVMHWNGSAWLDAAFPYLYADDYRVSAGWASSADDVWLGGTHGQDRTLFHWNGSTWSTFGPFGAETGGGLDGGGGFTSIWGAAANDIYAAAHTAVYHYDGDTWTPVTGITSAGTWAYYGNRVFGSSANDVYVTRDRELWRWNGTSWTKTDMPQTSAIGWASSPTDVWLSTYHYDGSLFVQYGSGNNVGALIGTSTDMFTFGDVIKSGSELSYGRKVTRWIGGFGGTPQVDPVYFEAGSAWRTPDGHIFAAGGGLIVH